MSPSHRIKKRGRDLNFGDIISLDVPFVENLPEYYNGYNPKDINPEPVTDMQGRSSKHRPVLVVSTNKDSILCMPISSRTRYNDRFYQFELYNNKALPNSDKYRSFIETESITRVPFNPNKPVSVFMTVHDKVKQGILSMTTRNLHRIDQFKDTYTITTPRMVKKYQESLKRDGFHVDKNVYSKNKLRITFEDNNVISFHHQRTLDEVRKLHHIDPTIDLSDLPTQQLTQ